MQNAPSIVITLPAKYIEVFKEMQGHTEVYKGIYGYTFFMWGATIGIYNAATYI